MKSLKTTFILFLFVFVNATAQQTTSKDSIKTTELDEVVVGIKKKAIDEGIKRGIDKRQKR